MRWYWCHRRRRIPHLVHVIERYTKLSFPFRPEQSTNASRPPWSLLLMGSCAASPLEVQASS